MDYKKNIFFLSLSFIEGAIVMGTELLGAKMLAPFFGSSLYVWASVMAITLGALACGYFIGGKLSLRKNHELLLYQILLIASLFTVMMPITSKTILNFLGHYSLLPAVICSTIIILFPPVFLMGIVSPIIIKLISKDSNESGNAAGTVYAISTFGGILSTLVFGFYIIPIFGLTKPSIFSGLILSVLPLIGILKKKKRGWTTLIVIIFFSVFQFFEKPITSSNGDELIYQSEGLLGQITIFDFANKNYFEEANEGEKSRWLYVNGISQTKENLYARTEKGEEKHFTYVNMFTEFLSLQPLKNKTVLLLGLGGGSLAKELTNKGFNVEACELDSRMAKIATEYFKLPSSVNVTIDDARHFINNTNKKYDVVIFDTFKGEETPSHLMTQESLKEVDRILNKDGYLLINSFNYIEGEKGIGLQSIYKTLEYSNFNTELAPTSSVLNDRNLLFFCSKNKLQKEDYFMDISNIDMSKATVLTDEIPSFEKLNGKASLDWRRWAIKFKYKFQ